MKATLISFVLVLGLCAPGFAQEQMPDLPLGGPEMLPPGGAVYRTFRTFGGPGSDQFFWVSKPTLGGQEVVIAREGGWWRYPDVVQKLHLSDEQVRKIKTIAQDHQLQAIDLRADVEKQETVLGFQMDADSPDESQVLAQIDKVTAARGRLEKSEVQAMLAERQVLTPEQAKQLRNLRPKAPPFPPHAIGFSLRAPGEPAGGPAMRPDAPPEPPQGSSSN